LLRYRQILYPIYGRTGKLLGMRYTKTALLTFGAGLMLGLVVIAFEIKSLQRVASGLMAFGIAAIPIGMVVDWRRATQPVRRVPRRRPSPSSRRRMPPRKPARPKR
jgi:hypothetical protein